MFFQDLGPQFDGSDGKEQGQVIDLEFETPTTKRLREDIVGGGYAESSSTKLLKKIREEKCG